jgi:superfamily II DNA/RNA helicase
MDTPGAAEIQLWLPLEDDDRGGTEDLPSDGVLGGTGLANEEEERAAIERILDAAAPAVRSESKLRVLLRLLGRVRESAIVFSEYRDTVERLRQELAERGHRVIVLHGGLTGVERRAAVTDFSRGQAVLVATDAASEGLNLHHRCRLVIHFELPWAPARLHQRCGRVNRIGQQRQVHEIALVLDDTAERLVLMPLIRRGGAAGSFGGGSLVSQLSESRVAARILGNIRSSFQVEASASGPRSLITMDLREEAAAEAERLELLRRASRQARREAKPVVAAARAPRRPQLPQPLLTFVIETTIRERGERIDDETIAVSAAVAGRSRRRRLAQAELAWLVERIGPQLSRRLVRRTARRLAVVRARHQQVRTAMLRREAAIDGALGSTARELVQAGLFDRQALRTPSRGVPPMPPSAMPGNGRPVLLARTRVRAVLDGSLR